MTRYKVLRKCFAYGRIWDVDQVTSFDFVPNHHFECVDEQPTVIYDPKPKKDIMKMSVGSGANTLSQIAEASHAPAEGGMASGLAQNAPVSHVNKIKKPRSKG